jgi:hypothetical protein
MWISKKRWLKLERLLLDLEKETRFQVDPCPLYPGEGTILVKSVVRELLCRLDLKLVHRPDHVTVEKVK